MLQFAAKFDALLMSVVFHPAQGSTGLDDIFTSLHRLASRLCSPLDHSIESQSHRNYSIASVLLRARACVRSRKIKLFSL